jgi:Tol biopolymer transport system component
MSFFQEIKRRRVFHVTVVYLVVAWLIMQVVDVVNEPLSLPDWFDTVVILILAIGFLVAVMLSWAYDITPEGVVRTDSEPGSPQTDTQGAERSRYGLVAIGALLLGALLAGNLAINLLPEKPASTDSEKDSTVRRFSVELPRSMRIVNNAFRPVSISPDGKNLVFSARVERENHLYIRPLGSLDVLPIAGADNASRAIGISPDGEWIAYQDRSDSLLKKIPSAGGIPVTLCDPGGNVWDISWGANNDIVFISDNFAGILSVSSAGGELERLTDPADGEYHKHVQFLPNGRAILFTIGERGNTTRRTDRIAALSLETGEQKLLMAGASPQATATGLLIYYAENALRAVAFDTDRLEVRSESMAAAEGILYSGTAHYNVSKDGTLVYVLATDLVRNSLVFVDRLGNEETLPIEPRPFKRPRVSPDGKQIAVVIRAENGADLWTYSIERRTSTRLTFDESLEASPVWSSDGRHIIYSSNRVDDLFRAASDGNGQVEQLTASPLYQFAYSLTPDGEKILFHESRSQAGPFNISALSMSEDRAQESLLESEFNEIHPKLSPDGRWLAYVSDRSGDPQVYVRPYPDLDSAVRQVSVDLGLLPMWSDDSQELFYWGADEMMSARIQSEPELRVEQPMPLFAHQGYYFESLGSFSYDRASGRFLMVKEPSPDEVPANRIIVVQNWLDEIAGKIAAE